MKTYIARQPIFDADVKVCGYELLYRDESNKESAVFTDGSVATSRLLDAAVNHFSLPCVTNFLPAYINFTENLILNDFADTVSPDEMVIEILEDVVIHEAVINKVSELKEKGYRLALDDYTGDSTFDPILPYMDIVKIDFSLVSEDDQAKIAEHLQSLYPAMKILAEKVETREDFIRARNVGFNLFQGYFFSKPRTIFAKTPSLAAASYGQLLREVNRQDGINFNALSRIVKKDALLTYRVLQRVRTLEYYRGNDILSVNSALVRMGEKEVRRWTYLMIAMENNVAESDELVHQAYLRGVFAQELMKHSLIISDSENGFLLGMFSLLDKILGIPIEDIIEEITLPKDINLALTGKSDDGYYGKLLNFINIYENPDDDTLLPDIGLKLDEEEIAELYLECLGIADKAYSM